MSKKFDRSQNAHMRLSIYHDSKRKDIKHKRLCGQHYEVYNEQEKRGSILSRREKRNIFKAWHSGE